MRAQPSDSDFAKQTNHPQNFASTNCKSAKGSPEDAYDSFADRRRVFAEAWSQHAVTAPLDGYLDSETANLDLDVRV